MKAIRLRAPGGVEAMRLEEVPKPVPKEGDALIRIEAAGVNFIDVYVRTGQYKAALPTTIGTEGAGTVEAVGAGVSGISAGDRVASVNMAGAYAEYATAATARLVPIPNDVTTRQAAAVMLQGMTAHYLATATYPLKPGDSCLVHAAAGGVGLLLCQIAKSRGARVLGTVSTAEKEQRARAAGADEVIRYGEVDFAAEARRLTGGKGLQVIYDSVGRTTFEKGLDALAQRGMMVLFGQSSGAVAPFDPQLLNQKGSLYVTRPTLAHYVATRQDLLERSGDVLRWVSEGRLVVKVDRELPLADAGEAHRLLESRQTSGKLLLIP
jgi:NADPH2:quinone reductase